MTQDPDKYNTALYRHNSGDKVWTPHCAEFTHENLREDGKWVVGNAWNPKGIKHIFNGYEGVPKPKEFHPDSVRQYNNAAANNVRDKFDSLSLDTLNNYVTQMMYQDSPYQEQAFKEGKKVASTHTGSARWINYNKGKKGYWQVVHNIGGTVHTDPLTKIQGSDKPWAITAISEPQDASPLRKAVQAAKKYAKSIKKEEGGTIDFLYPMIQKYNLNNGR